MISLKNSIRIVIILTVNSFIFIQHGSLAVFKILAETPCRKRPVIQDSSCTGTLSFSQFAICLCFPIIAMFCFLCYYHTNPLQLSAKFTFEPATEVSYWNLLFGF